MDRPRFQKTEGIVLKNMPLGEADRLLTLYTPHLGKVRAVARGVRRVKSHMGGHLEPLMCAQVLIARGNTLDVISQAETVQSNAVIRTDLWRTTCGLYLAELVDHFGSEGQESIALYSLLRDTLTHLAETPIRQTLVLRHFEMQLLMVTGFQPELYECINCGVALSPVTNSFSSTLGGVLCPLCRRQDPLARPLSLNALKVFRLLARGDFETTAKVKLDEDLGIEVEHCLRQYIRHVLEHDLKSTDFLDMLRRNDPAPALTSPHPK